MRKESTESRSESRPEWEQLEDWVRSHVQRLRNVYPQAAEQRCWNHKIVNVLAKLPKRQQD